MWILQFLYRKWEIHYKFHYILYYYNCFRRIDCNPVVGECDGTYTHESRRNQLVWSLPLIDATNKSGSLEFSAPRAIPNDFFPVSVNFSSKSSYARIKVSCFCFVLHYQKQKFVPSKIWVSFLLRLFGCHEQLFYSQQL